MNEADLSTPTGADPIAALNGVTQLSHLGVIRVEGDDAAKFLHAQLTQDFSLLGTDTARLAAFCSAKGRMQASFIGFKQSQAEVLLICSRDLLAATLKRLSMFVMRAKAKLTDASEAYSLVGLTGTTLLGSERTPWSLVRQGDCTAINLYPALGIPRQLAVTPVEHPMPAGPALALDLWLWSEVRSGVATLNQAVFEAFVPQMLNFESVGGVNFKKGCYPGQEVVARSQFRGTLKRRAHIFHADVAMQPGQDVFHSLDPDQPVGVIVQTAAAPRGGWDAIVSLQIGALEAGSLHLLAATGPALQQNPLPYVLLDDI